MKMNFAIGMGRNERMDEIAELSRLADEHGFTHATFVDEPYLARDVHVMATVAALNTKRLIIGQGVVDPKTYHPSALANAAASLHELTGGRAFLGMGAGGPFGKLMVRPIGTQTRGFMGFRTRLIVTTNPLINSHIGFLDVSPVIT